MKWIYIVFSLCFLACQPHKSQKMQVPELFSFFQYYDKAETISICGYDQTPFERIISAKFINQYNFSQQKTESIQVNADTFIKGHFYWLLNETYYGLYSIHQESKEKLIKEYRLLSTDKKGTLLKDTLVSFYIESEGALNYCQKIVFKDDAFHIEVDKEKSIHLEAWDKYKREIK